jgi:hypothetical protein
MVHVAALAAVGVVWLAVFLAPSACRRRWAPRS